MLMLISQLLFCMFLIPQHYSCIWYFKQGCSQMG